MIRDLRRYASQTTTRLFVGFLLLLFLVGEGLIYIFLGPQAAVLGVLCILGGLAPMILIALVLLGIEWVVKKADQ
jgi:hypothetical protein